MQLFIDKNLIEFSEFAKDFPHEASILKDYQKEPWTFLLEGRKIHFLHGAYKPIFIDIKNILNDHRVYFTKNSFYQENLARALGIKKGKPRVSFCDATAGLLGDTLMMSCFDINKLDVYERHPVAAALIVNALSCCESKVNFHYKSAADITSSYDVIFYDPMYEDKSTKSAPKKEMQIFRDVIGADTDSPEIAGHLRLLATERLVIKRPIKSSLLLESPSHQIKGKSTRFDVYMNV
jgi:16S rRNA (guanine1516-N2)-methyltransferase